LTGIDVLLLIAGVAGTWLGAELLVRGSAHIALALGVRPLVVGLTVVAFGTSSPEAVVSLLAALRHSGDIAVGNVVGSNIANIGLILGLLAVLHPVRIQWSEIRDDVLIMCAATAVAIVLGLNGHVSRLEGVLLLLLLGAYLTYYVVSGHRPPEESPLVSKTESSRGLLASVLQTVLGLLILVAGAHALLDGAQHVALAFGVPDAVIGATMVAVGTSLPELAASVVAVTRGHHEIGVGNIVGSNVMNLLFVLGGVGTIAPVAVEPRILHFLFPVMAAYTFGLIPLMRTGWRISRLEGGLLLATYVAVSWYLF
jgi:cation:H+ antiporter